jgi:2'-5' RNA ligase
MRKLQFYRYFLCWRPDPLLGAEIAALAGPAGQTDHPVRAERLHMTSGIVSQTKERNHFIASRIDAAFARKPLPSCLVRFGRVRGGAGGATLYARGCQDELRAARRYLLGCLARRGIAARETKRAHVTLGYSPCTFAPFDFVAEWVPSEVLLIESEVGLTKHNVLGSWPLLPPAQGAFAFQGSDSLLATSWRLAG